MPRGRKPQGEQALSNAQRQARYRARRAVVQPRPTPRSTLRQSRPQRWRAALAELGTRPEDAPVDQLDLDQRGHLPETAGIG